MGYFDKTGIELGYRFEFVQCYSYLKYFQSNNDKKHKQKLKHGGKELK